jgi:hypothetical protein
MAVKNKLIHSEVLPEPRLQVASNNKAIELDQTASSSAHDKSRRTVKNKLRLK